MTTATAPATATPTKETILEELYAFINQRPGMEWANYQDRNLYQAEYRRIKRDLDDARTLVSEVAWRSITAQELLEGIKMHGRRLTWNETGFDYCAGQYFPTEYRAAVCRLLSGILWDYFRDGCQAKSPRDYARTQLRRHGRLASRWFN